MPTIVDRCQRFDFQRPSLEQLAEVLRRVADAESIEVSDGAIAAIARAAGGSFRDALGTLDQLVSYGDKRLETDDVLAVLGVADAELILAAADAIAAGDGRAALQASDRLSRSGRDVTQFARDLLAHLRQLIVIRTIGDTPDSFTVTAAEPERLRAQAESMSDLTLGRAVDTLSKALTDIREGDEPRMTVELAILRAARPQLDPSREALAERLERLERGAVGSATGVAASDPAPAPADEADDEPPAPSPRMSSSASSDPAPEAPNDVSLEKLTGTWPAVVDQVRQGGAELLSHVLAAARPVAVNAEDATVEIGFPASAAFNKRKAEGNEARETVTEAVQTIVGERLRPVFVLLDSDEGGSEERELSEDELVELMRSEFDAEYVEPDDETPEAKEA
jgi:DNA polymerase III subunit gamma/tau